MRKIILCPNPKRDPDYALTRRMAALVRDAGAESVVCLPFPGEAEQIPTEFPLAELEDELSTAEMIAVFGGDGTILRVARAAALHGVPILGVNLGNKGFMAELEREDADRLLLAVQDRYDVGLRMMLDVTLERDGKSVGTDIALNDVVVGGIARLVPVTVLGDGRRITEFVGDGVIVATPTGSTAYSLSAGGPIVEPAAENILVTPICAHMLIARSFVLAPDRNVTVEIGDLGRKEAYVTVDGHHSQSLMSFDRLHIRRSRFQTKLIHISDKSFYERVGEKLGDVRQSGGAET